MDSPKQEIEAYLEYCMKKAVRILITQPICRRIESGELKLLPPKTRRGIIRAKDHLRKT